MINRKGGQDLTVVVRRLEELVLAESGVDSFWEILKLFYAKLYDEKQGVRGKKYEARITNYGDVVRFFEQAKREWRGIFDEHEKIALSSSQLAVCVDILWDVTLLDTDLAVFDAAFEYLLPSVAKGNRGQYFTPRHVIAAIVFMLNPKKEESLLDPACGSGGFLWEAIDWMGKEGKFSDKKGHHVFGIDFDEKAFAVARMLMLVAGHGEGNIFRFNSLEKIERVVQQMGIEYTRTGLPRHTPVNPPAVGSWSLPLRSRNDVELFDLVLTNPPFGGEVRDEEILTQYALARDAKGKMRGVVERHVLFLERIISFLKPGGRAGVVVPQGLLNNRNFDYIRQWLFGQARILGVIGLDGNTFKPHTNVKTSILLLQKWEGEPPGDYPIFMAVSEKGGKDKSGKLVVKDGELENDLGEIGERFREFARKEELGFWG